MRKPRVETAEGTVVLRQAFLWVSTSRVQEADSWSSYVDERYDVFVQRRTPALHKKTTTTDRNYASHLEG